MTRFIPSILLMMLALALIAFNGVQAAILKPPTTMPVLDLSGQEQPEDDAIFINGYNVVNHGPVRLLDAYVRYRDWLAEPIGPFTGLSQDFRFGQLTFNATNAPDWQIELANAGEADLRVSGYQPQRASSPHPALRDYLVDLHDRGLDPSRLVGPVISPPICNQKTKLCSQWTMKARFEFPESALTGDAVRRLPLGLWLSHPKTRPIEVDESASSSPLHQPGLWIGLVFGLLALVLLRRPRDGGITSAPL